MPSAVSEPGRRHPKVQGNGWWDVNHRNGFALFFHAPTETARALRDTNPQMAVEFEHFSPEAFERVHAESFVRQIEFHRELSSTNDLALQLAGRDDFQTPLLVLTENQTAGRGRSANRWWTNSGALTFSLVIEAVSVNLPAKRWPQVSLTAGLAVCEALGTFLPEARLGLKWPNDVYLKGRKLCGILVEVPPQRTSRLVLGIGINVNNSFRSASHELQAIATSLFDVFQNHFDLTDVLVPVLKQLARRLESLVAKDACLWNDWQQLCLLRGRTVHLEIGSGRIVGVCRGIDPDGALLLQTESGIERVFSGVVSRIEPDC